MTWEKYQEPSSAISSGQVYVTVFGSEHILYWSLNRFVVLLEERILPLCLYSMLFWSKLELMNITVFNGENNSSNK